MGTNSLREQAKIRKPYTITKQREKWTDEEHNRFLEALRLYGRAWQHIQEHIGTKSAVQIRSHAQKFFLKLEKGNGGMPLEHSHGIEIPPPRPKRKPYNSYPRKAGAASQNPSVEIREKDMSKAFVLQTTDKVILDTKAKTIGEGTPSTSVYFHNGDISECSQERIPMMDELNEKRIRLTKELKGNDAELRIFGMNGNFTESHFGFISSGDNLGNDHCHEKVATQIKGPKNSDEGISTSFLTQLQANADLNLSLDSTRQITNMPKTSAAVSSIHHTVPSASLVNHLHCDDNAFNTLTNLTNYFPSLLASALSQNPAIHQAASIAATLLPPTYADFPVHSNTKSVGDEAPEKQSSASSCMSAIVTATVAAASAWWRVHGLLPSPFLANHAQLRTMEVSHAHEVDNVNFKENVNQNHKQKSAMQTQPCTALLEPSSSHNTYINQAPEKKKHDPSSSDSNTSPSCEVEKDSALYQKGAKFIIAQGEEAPYIIQEFRDSQNSKSLRNGIEQGQLAFQALFSKEVLPQSFSPEHLDANLLFNSGKEEALGLQIDLNRKLFTASTCNVSKGVAQDGSGMATHKKHFVEIERNYTDQEESSTKRAACL